MDFNVFENLMHKRGYTSLADIARALNTTPQAVSNWKSRNQVPSHVIAGLNRYQSNDLIDKSSSKQNQVPYTQTAPTSLEVPAFTFSDIFLALPLNFNLGPTCDGHY